MAGNATIGSLNVKLGLDSAQFTEGLKASQTRLSGFAKDAAVAGAAVGAAFAAAAIGLGVAVKASINAADELSKTAQKVGVGVEQLSRLKYAAELSDVSLDGLSTGLKKLSVSMVNAQAHGTGPAAEAFQRLGISVTDASGHLKDGNTVLTEVAGKFSGLNDGATKTALAVAIFGKSGSELIPLLNSGADGLKAMGAEADALGVTIDEKTGAAAESFNDNLTRLKKVGEGITTQLAAGLLPGLLSVSNVMVSGAKNTQFMSEVSAVLSGVLKGLASAGVILGAVFDATFKTVIATAHAVMQVVRGDFSGAVATMSQKVDSFDGIVGRLKAIWSQTGATGPKVAPKVTKDIDETNHAIAKGGDDAAKAVKAAADKLQGEFENLHDSLLSDDQRYLNKYLANLQTLEEARRTGLISEQQYLVELEALENQKATRGIKPATLATNIAFTNTPADLEKAAAAMRRTRTEAEQVADAFYDVADAVEGAFRGLQRGDWFGASRAIVFAAQSLKDAFSSTGTTAGRIGAVGGLAAGIGGAIGGTGGALLGGIGGGAAAGAGLVGSLATAGVALGPIGVIGGAAIGAVLGGVASLFGSSKAKKAKKKAEAQAAADAAAAAAAAEAARLQDIANQKRQLEIQLMRAQGDEQGALNAERADALKNAASPEIAASMQKLYDLADAATAAGKAAAISSEAHQLEIAALRAAGDEAGATALENADWLAGLNSANRALGEGVLAAKAYADAVSKAQEKVSAAEGKVKDAQDALSAARDREASALQATVSKFRALQESLTTYAASLSTAAAPGGASTAALVSQFKRTAAEARLGSADAQGALVGLGQQLIASATASAHSQDEVNKITDDVLGEVQAAAATAGRTADIAQQQLDSLNAQVDALLGVNGSVISVREAIDGLAAAMAAQAEAVAALAAIQPPAPVINITIPGFSVTDPMAGATGAGPGAAVDGTASGPADATNKEIADALAEQTATLNAIARNTGVFADNSDQWTEIGLPTTVAA